MNQHPEEYTQHEKESEHEPENENLSRNVEVLQNLSLNTNGNTLLEDIRNRAIYSQTILQKAQQMRGDQKENQ